MDEYVNTVYSGIRFCSSSLEARVLRPLRRKRLRFSFFPTGTVAGSNSEPLVEKRRRGREEEGEKKPNKQEQATRRFETDVQSGAT